MVSARLPAQTLEDWGLSPTMNVGPFNTQQSVYLDFHRTQVFKAKA
jgi:hypothetical protein